MAVECFYSGKKIYVTAGDVHSRLPVRHRGGVVIMYPWGQGRVFYDQPAPLRLEWPRDPWVPLETIKNGGWAGFRPKAVRIAVTRFMVYRGIDEATDAYWVTLEPGQYLQGALLQHEVEHTVYVVTVEPPADLRILTPWPRIVSARRKPEE